MYRRRLLAISYQQLAWSESFSRLEDLAQVTLADVGVVRGHDGISQGGVIRSDQSTSACRIFNPSEHCRGLRSKHSTRFCSLPAHCSRIGQQTRISLLLAQELNFMDAAAYVRL